MVYGEEEQLRRITESHIFRNSDSLCRLLVFLAEHAKLQPLEPLREYDIATKVFNRRADFNPQLDSTVRVQMGRLRGRLVQYYTEAGLKDDIVFELPKGSYSVVLSYRNRPQAQALTAKNDFQEVSPLTEMPVVHHDPPPPASGKRNEVRNIALAVLLTAIVAVCAGALLLTPKRHKLPQPLQAFWAPFVSVDKPPLVIYSNQAQSVSPPAVKLNQPEAIPAAAPAAPAVGLYTGVGEVMGAVKLTHMFDSIGHEILFRRGAITSWEDAKDLNLIFIGTANQAFQTLAGSRRFVIRHSKQNDLTSPMAIADLSPKPGRPALYVRSGPCCESLEEDYALVNFSRGLAPGLVALTLAGATTLGTQAAIDFVCDPQEMALLSAALPKTSSGQLPFFEAVLHVRIRGGSPIQSDIVEIQIDK